MIDHLQIRAARAMLGWTLSDLAERAKVTGTHISSIERGTVRTPREETFNRIQEAFEKAGLEFLPGSGVRKRDSLGGEVDGVEIIPRGTESLGIVAKRIHQANSDIMVYGRGPAGLSQIQREYMASITYFLKTKPYTYTRMLLISTKFLEASYLWLVFIRKLLSDRSLRPKMTIRILEVDSPPVIYTPMQAIGNNFVHYTLGGLSFNPEEHINNMMSFFVRGENYCDYFTNLLRRTLLNLEGNELITNRNINIYCNRYKAEIEKSDNEKDKLFIRDAEEFVDDICDPFLNS